jgi:hypothetical protein
MEWRRPGIGLLSGPSGCLRSGQEIGEVTHGGQAAGRAIAVASRPTAVGRPGPPGNRRRVPGRSGRPRRLRTAAAPVALLARITSTDRQPIRADPSEAAFLGSRCTVDDTEAHYWIVTWNIVRAVGTTVAQITEVEGAVRRRGGLRK